MSKTHLGGLFARDRTMRLPLTRGWTSITVSERSLRNLVTGMIFLFLLTLGLALAMQLYTNRQTHLVKHNKLSQLYLKVAASDLGGMFATGVAMGLKPQVPNSQDIKSSLPPDGDSAGRQYLIVGEKGKIISAWPDKQELVGKLTSQILSFDGLTKLAEAPDGIFATQLQNGTETFVGVASLLPYPGNLVMIHTRGEMLRAWRENVTQISILFGVTFMVLLLLGAAFHWQSSRAGEADQNLNMVTERLDKALERGRCGLWDWNMAQGLIFWSKSMYEILGLEPSNKLLTYGELAERLHPDDDPIDTLAEQMLKGDRPAIDQEFRMRHNDGHWVWLRARCEMAEAPGEEAPHLVGIAIDITEHKKNDKANKEAETRLKDAIENISEAFVLWDNDNRLVMCNSKYQQFHNLPASACVPGAPYSRVSEAATEPSVSRKRVVENKGGKTANKNFEVRLADGRWLQINERRTRDGGFVSVGTDITEIKMHEERLEASHRELMRSVRELQKARMTAEQQSQKLGHLAEQYSREKTRAEAANRSKSEFLANMSHELRTPLNAILGFSEIMENQTFGPIGTEKYIGYASDIHKSGQFLLDVINDILDMSKIEAGRVDLDVKQIDLDNLVVEALRIAGPRATQNKFEIINNVTGGLTIMADKRAVKQVLINLLTNAIKFTPEEGQINISAFDLEDKVQILIEDTGIGIPASELNKLGQPFAQVENQFTKSRGGSGLGLAISRSLIELHGGSLMIDSVEGEGTSVSVTLNRQVLTSGDSDNQDDEKIQAAATA